MELLEDEADGAAPPAIARGFAKPEDVDAVPGNAPSTRPLDA
jgi:hypothetical protein